MTVETHRRCSRCGGTSEEMNPRRGHLRCATCAQRGCEYLMEEIASDDSLALIPIGEETCIAASDRSGAGRDSVPQFDADRRVVRLITREDAVKALEWRATRLITEMPMYLHVRVRRLEVARDRAVDNGDFKDAERCHVAAASEAATWPKRGSW